MERPGDCSDGPGTVLKASLDRPRSKPCPVLHSVDIAGRSLRWFSSPTWIETGSPDHPWHSFDDLCSIIGLPEPAQVELRRSMKVDWVRDVRTVAVEDGTITTIAPHFAAQGLFGMLRYRRKLLPTETRHRIQNAYFSGQTKAVMKMVAHLDGVEKLAFLLAGWR